MDRRLAPRWICAALLYCLASFATGPIWSVRPARAQQLEVPAPDARERDRLYRELAQDVALLEKQLGLLKRVAKLVGPTVVHIEATKARQLNLGYGQRGLEEAGSGVVIQLGEKYYILTNRHVIKYAEPETILVRLADGREIHPKKVWSDPESDVAVMAVEAPRLVAARLGDSDKLEIGQFVLAVGSPFGLSKSVTYGIISAKGRRDLELGEDDVHFQDFIQTDAAINPGNSGGPLMNLRGELVGINTAIASSSGGNEGIGFTIPINMVMVIAEQLIEHGSVTRAFLGVNLDSKFGPAVAARMGLPRPQGARITKITPKSPAEEAKLRVDDIILQFGGVRVEDDDHLINLVGLTEVGKAVELVVFRDRKAIRITVKVGDRSQFSARPE